MKAILILGMLCALTMQQTVLVSSSPDSVLITDPPGYVPTVDGYYALHNPNFIGYDAQWVYKNGTGGWPTGDYAVIFTEFYADCTSGVTLIITADDEFTASVNGGPAYVGNDWQKIYKFNLDCLKCGVNTLSIRVTNSGKANSPSAVIFAVVQDQSLCYNCSSPLSYYNKKTCQCECLDHCDCSSINSCFAFSGYPVCGCKCKKIENCPPCSFFNENTCKCECKPAACLPGYTFDNNSCKCVNNCPKKTCPSCQVWNQYQCKCVCPVVLVCKSYETWNADKCVCEKNLKRCDPNV